MFFDIAFKYALIRNRIIQKRYGKYGSKTIRSDASGGDAGRGFDWAGLATWIREPHPNPHTVHAYRNDLQAFFTFLKNADRLPLDVEETPPTLDDLIGFLNLPAKAVNARLEQYEQAMRPEPVQGRRESRRCYGGA
jgi:hypothetical protein